MNIKDYSWTEDLIPPVDHPDNPARIYHADYGNRELGEARHAAEGMLEGGIGVEVRF